jgi:hypothetical protein
VLSHINFPASGTRSYAPQQAALRFAQKGQQHSTASVEQQAYPSAKKPQFEDAPFVDFSWKLALFTQVALWGLPSNSGDDSRAVLHTLVGVLHSALFGEESSERGRGKGTGS